MYKILLAASVFFMISCNSEKSAKNHAHENTEMSETQDAHNHNHAQTNAIELNNGAKWVVNEEMKPYVSNIKDRINTYVANNETDYKKLAADLEVENTRLIKSCTMKGKSHDELHKWLHPHLDIVKRLKQEEDPEKAKALVGELVTSGETYDAHFN